MLCEKCGKREATTYYSENINGKKREMHLCSECAKDEGIGNFNFGFTFPSLFSDFFGDERYAPLAEEKKCPTCNMTLSEFSRTGRVGCPDCYTAFEDEFRPMLLKMQKGDRHKGSRPGSEPEKKHTVDSLKAELKEAIEKEDFERAAVLRDKIKEEENKNEK